MLNSKRVVITGANRGIGFSFCQQAKAQGMEVFAVCRTPSKALEALDVTVVSGCDMAKPETLTNLKQALEGIEIDLLINNAGILDDEVLGAIDYEQIEKQFLINALGPLRVTELLLPNLKDGAKVAMITSRMGSIADNTSGGRYGYRMSKTALNIASVSLAQDLKPKSIAVGIFHPGFVSTEMVGGHGEISPDEAADRLMARIQQLSMETSGQFFHSSGEPLPW